MTDIFIIETGSGGDVVLKGKDLLLAYSFENMPYLALFGGNLKASTAARVPNEQAFDYWGNTLFFADNTPLQMNSLTERTLHTVPLTSAGRIAIEEAVNADLEFMKAFAEVKVEVKILDTDKVQIGISLRKPDNLENKEFIYIWEAGRIYTPDANYPGDRVRPEYPIFLEESLQYDL